MVRVRHSVSTRRRKRRILKKTKGQFGQRHSRYRQAKRSLIKGMVYAYRDRKVNKRQYRSLWIIRINAACRELGIPYSRFIKGLTDANVFINRKMLAHLAVTAPETFQELVNQARNATPKKTAATRKPARARAGAKASARTK